MRQPGRMAFSTGVEYVQATRVKVVGIRSQRRLLVITEEQVRWRAVELRDLRAADLLGAADNAAGVLEYALERAIGLPSAQFRPDESKAVPRGALLEETAGAPKPWENLLDLSEALTAELFG